MSLITANEIKQFKNEAITFKERLCDLPSRVHTMDLAEFDKSYGSLEVILSSVNSIVDACESLQGEMLQREQSLQARRKEQQMQRKHNEAVIRDIAALRQQVLKEGEQTPLDVALMKTLLAEAQQYNKYKDIGDELNVHVVFDGPPEAQKMIKEVIAYIKRRLSNVE